MPIYKKAVLFIGDIILLYGALAVTLLIRYSAGTFGAAYSVHIGPFSTVFLLWLIVLYLSDLYRLSALRTTSILTTRLATAAGIAGTLSVLLFYLFGDFFLLTPKTNLFIFIAVFFILAILFRVILRRFFTAGATGVLLIGDSPLTDEVAAYLTDSAYAGYRLAHRMPKAPENPYPALEAAIRESRAAIVVLPSAASSDFALLDAAYRLLPLGVTVLHFRDFYEMLFERVPLREVDTAWFIENISTRRPFYDSAKRALDLLGGVVLSIVISPIALVIATLVRLSSPGPAVFRQRRIGRLGEPFTLYKFRTMVVNHNGLAVTLKNDPRLTRVGAFINYTHLNEIPQLWNIVKGDISFIGPRPESEELVAKYRALPHYEFRNLVKPGLTGWAQINFRPSTSIEEAYEKLTYDMYYVKNRSFVLDFLIILKTVRYVFTPPES